MEEISEVLTVITTVDGTGGTMTAGRENGIKAGIVMTVDVVVTKAIMVDLAGTTGGEDVSEHTLNRRGCIIYKKMVNLFFV